jgi:hypothetical protein
MPIYKVLQDVKLCRVERGPEVGIAAQILYKMVKPDDAGYDLYDKQQLARLQEEFMPLGENRFTFTVEEFSKQGYWRVFAEPKK